MNEAEISTRAFPLTLTRVIRGSQIGLTVNRQMAKILTISHQKRNIFTVKRQISEPMLAVNCLRYP